MKITVLGSGHFAIAIAHFLSKKENNNIVMWTHDEEKEKEFLKHRSLPSIMDHKFNKNITVTASLEESLKDSKLIYVVTTSNHFLDLMTKVKKYYNDTPICIATKGIEENKKELLSNIVKNVLKTKNIAALSGPSFAIDMMNNYPVALALGSRSKKTINLVNNTLAGDTLKLRVTNDLEGIQLSGAVKNIIAIGAGIISGMGYPESTLAFYLTESIHDIKNAMHVIGGKKKTILSFAGIGDLILTSTSTKSRNFSFGYTVGKHQNKTKTEEFLKNNTVEGYFTLKSVYSLLNDKNVKMPIIEILYNIIYENDDPKKLISFLIEKE